MNIAQLLHEQVLMAPDRPAIVDARGSTTYAELDRAAGRMATALRSRGIGVGDTVLVFVGMSRELYAILTAIFRIGAVGMFLDPSAGRKHIERCCAITPPKAFIASPKAHLLRIVSGAVRRIPVKFSSGVYVPGSVSWKSCMRQAPLGEIFDAREESAALVTFTSGSTGLPKAAMRTHGFLLAQHRALEQSIDLRPGQVDLATLPIFALSNLTSGLTTVIPDADLRSVGKIDPVGVLEQIRRHGVERSAGSPAFFDRLATECERTGGNLVGFKRIYTGGAPVFPRLMERLQKLAPKAEVKAVYGSTEAEPIAHVAFREMSEEDLKSMLGGKGLLAGTIVESIQLRVLPNRFGKPIGPFTAREFDQACLSVGQAGELVVCGDHVLKGYLNGVGDEATKFQVEGKVWHRTGDAGYLDEGGRLWLLGRCEARVVDEYGEMYPFAVECAATNYPGVKRAALVQENRKRVLVVEGEVEGLKEALVWAHLDGVQRVDEIPVDKRHNAKVDYVALREMLRGMRM